MAQTLAQTWEKRQRSFELLVALGRGAREAAHLEVLEDRQTAEYPATLRRLRDTQLDQVVGRGRGDVLALEDDLALARMEQPARSS